MLLLKALSLACISRLSSRSAVASLTNAINKTLFHSQWHISKFSYKRNLLLNLSIFQLRNAHTHIHIHPSIDITITNSIFPAPQASEHACKGAGRCGRIKGIYYATATFANLCGTNAHTHTRAHIFA